jgi:hypothetical protein
MASAEPKRCLGCGYILDYLPEPRCPECGRGFDRNDASTYASGYRRPGGLHLLLALVSPPAAVGLIVLCQDVYLVLVFAFLAAAVELYVGIRSLYELAWPAWVQPRRTAWLLALAMSIFLCLTSCGFGVAFLYGLGA